MKQTAVEWLTEKLRNEFGFAFSNNIFDQAKEMEKEQQDKFAIEFAEWLTYNRENNYTKSIKELLEIFKKKII